MISARVFLLLFAAVVFSKQALAAGVPEQLRNKTIAMHWGTSGMGKDESGGTRTFSNINSRNVYVSSAGRTFLRKQTTSTGAGRIGRGGEFGPGEGSGGSVRIEGNRLIGVESFMNGARQYIATFDASFSSCTLVVIDAKAGNASASRRGPDGALYELSSITTSSPSCSIQNGNTIGGQ